ncbi:MAG TPA: tetratricopeptide repeat protein [Thermodesulfovibrionales bacterium]|nr:tetratricopeptide repeat protein [Thermodesulfovibrionales bacterium]
MALEEIEKLRLRVEKDQSSRLFLPLAEEYRKAGMPDEAIAVLSKGLERHPGYTSARVAIGRLYLEKNMFEEAKAEFEKVISVAPDNLFAHRKLADIYRDLGDKEKAAAQYRTLLSLNPLDDDARSCLDAVEAGVAEEHAVSLSPEAATIEETALEEEVTAGSGEDEFQEVFAGEEVPDIEVTELEEPQVLEEDFEEFSKSLSREFEIEEARVKGAEVFSEEAILSPAHQAFEDIAEVREPEKQSEDAVFAIGMSTADSLVSSKNYSKALEAYRGMLARYPGNTQLLQRVAELKAFLKLIGRGEEVVISKLEALREGIHGRFSGSH